MRAMSRSRKWGLAAAIAPAMLAALAATAGAATVTVGPKLSSATVSSSIVCENSGGCTVAQKTPSYVSPVTGMIVRWRVKGSAGPLTLRVLDGNTGGSGIAFGTAEAGKISSFPAEVPIDAGDRFGLDLPNISGAKLGYEKRTATFLSWDPALATGETRGPKEVAGAELLANVDIQPAPGITAVAPAAGPVGQQTTVTISGHDFEEVRSVEFGGGFVGFEVLSESTIVAQAVGFTPGTIPVTVTTRAGSATLPAAFTFEPEAGPTLPVIPPITGISPIVIPPEPPSAEEALCRVPRLKGRTLGAAKRELAAAHCRLGQVTRKRGVTAKRGRVVGQVPPAGAPAPAGSHVRIRLG